MQRKNYTGFDTEFVILDERGKTALGLALAPLLSCGGVLGAFWAPPEMEGIWRL